MKISENGINLIKSFEGLHDGNLSKIGLQPKMCPAGIWTVGYGHALTNKVTKKWLSGAGDLAKIPVQYPEFVNMSEQQAVELLKTDLEKYEGYVLSWLKKPVTQNQFDALVSFTFNCGISKTLFDLVNAGRSNAQIAKWIETHYVTAGGVRMNGLVRRRGAEAKMFNS